MSTADIRHPVVAQARQLVLIEPPSVLDILSAALQGIESSQTHSLVDVWLYLKIDTNDCPEALAFHNPRPRVYCNLIRLVPQDHDLDFVLPLEILAKYGPSDWALLCFLDDLVTLIFHDLGPTPTREDIEKLLARSKYFEEVRGMFNPERLVLPTRVYALEWVEKNQSKRPVADVDLARQIVEQHFSQVAA